MAKELTQGNVIKLEVGEKLSGKYVGCDQSAQYPDSYAFKVNTDEGTKVTFVNNIVRDLLVSNRVKEGDLVTVEFTEMKDNKAGTRQYKNFKVFLE